MLAAHTESRPISQLILPAKDCFGSDSGLHSYLEATEGLSLSL